MLQVRCNKHNVHHHEQKLHGEIVEQNGDKEFEQILLGEQLLAMTLGRQQIAKFHQNLQPLRPGDLKQGSARDDSL
jgi:hypothetical protein